VAGVIRAPMPGVQPVVMPVRISGEYALGEWEAGVGSPILRAYNVLDPARVTYARPVIDTAATVGTLNGRYVAIQYDAAQRGVYWHWRLGPKRWFFPQAHYADTDAACTLYLVLRAPMTDGDTNAAFVELDCGDGGFSASWSYGMTYHPDYNPSYDFTTIKQLAVPDAVGGYLPSIRDTWFVATFLIDEATGITRYRVPAQGIDVNYDRSAPYIRHADQIYLWGAYSDLADLILREGLDDAATIAATEADLATRWGL